MDGSGTRQPEEKATDQPTEIVVPLDDPTTVLDPVAPHADDSSPTAVQPVIPAPPIAAASGLEVPPAATAAAMAAPRAAPTAASPSYLALPAEPVADLSTRPAGWYPDPWASNAQHPAGVLRHWDGVAWTGYTSGAPTPRPRLGIPGWVLLLWWVLVMAVGVGVFFVVVAMAAFACDSGWDGCSQAVADGISVYVIVAVLIGTVPPLLAVAIGRGRRLGRVLRILAMIVMPLGLLAGFLASLGLVSSRFPG